MDRQLLFSILLLLLLFVSNISTHLHSEILSEYESTCLPRASLAIQPPFPRLYTPFEVTCSVECLRPTQVHSITIYKDHSPLIRWYPKVFPGSNHHPDPHQMDYTVFSNWFHLTVYSGVHARYPRLRSLMSANSPYAYGHFHCSVEFTSLGRDPRPARIESARWKVSNGATLATTIPKLTHQILFLLLTILLIL